jgi:hypothetical protein
MNFHVFSGVGRSGESSVRSNVRLQLERASPDLLAFSGVTEVAV